MGLRVNKFTIVNLSRFFHPVMVCSNFSAHPALLLINHHRNASYERKLAEANIPIKVFRRNYALKLYSQFIPEKETLGDKVIDYIKSENNFHSQLPTATVSNVFDNESAIKQIQSVVLHSLESQPNEVIKLFTLYESYNRFKLHDTFKIKQSSTIMCYRIQSTVLLMTLPQLHQFAIVLRGNAYHKVEFFKQLSKFVFEECLARAETSESIKDVLKYFIIGIELYGNNISSKNGYLGFLEVFQRHIPNATPSELSQVMYFSGLAKKSLKKNNTSSDLPVATVKILIPHFDELSFIDAGLVANALYKLNLSEFDISSLVSSKIIKEISSGSSTIFSTNLNSFAIVSLIKYLRLTLYKDQALMQSLKTALEQVDESSFNPQLVCHMLALFANANFYDQSLFTTSADIFFKFLRSSNDVIRIKDISRFMWAVSHAQHQCKIEDFNLVIDNLFNFAKTGEIQKHASHVIDSTLALATLNIFSEKLMKTVIQADTVKYFEERVKNRYLARLQVLSEVQKVTFPSLKLELPPPTSTQVPQRKISMELKYRPSMKCISEAARWLTKECGVKIFNLEFLIPHIHYCSLVLTDRTSINHNAASEIGKRVLENLASLNDFKIAIDINDENTALNNGTKANGLESLKRNLLQMQGWDVKVLSTADIKNCGEDRQALAALLLKTVQC